MSKQRKAASKKKARELRSKDKVLSRREKLRSQARANKIIALQEKYLSFENNTIVNEEKRDAYFSAKNAALDLKLEQNIAILKKIARELDEEDERRDELNSILEEQGHKTLDEKVKALAEMSLNQEE